MNSRSNIVLDTCWGNFPLEIKKYIDQVENIIENNIDSDLRYLINHQTNSPVWHQVWRLTYYGGILLSLIDQIEEEIEKNES